MGLPVLHLVLFLEEPFAVLICELRVGPRPVGITALAELGLRLESVISEMICDVRKLSGVDTFKNSGLARCLECLGFCEVMGLSARYGSFSAHY